mmetsp:Transcript_22302/g.26826  ORF Transcript_22302/g.26826 Transcript_22302/m.26826 type:complete len:397 (+) Transcript_22302:122-1312(+)|eukprot:CAMPEP_0197851418 /NCGR_PEP_ID=MMETSP1438-20131217/18040_1 /TAXON_ID=1461541 /ORGANISM="Pterosperma sp., Strain CCMP1384" /LENGTH=396 /DNA_ID=CAMNT_0043465011 /DNA_START=121 /DNA_END=1311 /DNA_ORIENTATION=+
MGSGGTDDNPFAHLMSSTQRSQQAEDPTVKAKAILSEFRNAEERNAEIEAKLTAARMRRVERGRKSNEVSVTPITLLSTSPPKERWKTSWSYSDPLEVSGSWSQHESMMKQAKQLEREQFLKELDLSKKDADEKYKRDKEVEADMLRGAKQRREHEDFILQQVMNRRSLEMNELEQRHRFLMERSQKAMDNVIREKGARQEHLSDQESNKANQALKKLDEQDEFAKQQVLNEHQQNEVKRAAVEFKAQKHREREQFLAYRKNKEEAFKAKWAAMEEENERKRREFLQKKLQTVEKRATAHAESVDHMQQEIHGRTVRREFEHDHRLGLEEKKWEQKKATWTTKGNEKVERAENLKLQKEEYNKQLMTKGKASIKHKAMVEELYFSAQVCNKLVNAP